MPADQHILHVDMDAFFAAVERRDNPFLRGKPVLIGHDGPRGVVATASYEARPFGCHSAQPMAIAKRLCPQAIILTGRGDHYREVSGQMFAILDDLSPVIEPLSIDEAFLDLTGSERALGQPEAVATRLRKRIRTELHLTASVGLAPNKFLAKLASDLDKPDGLTIIRPGDVDTILPPLPITRLWGIGKVTAARLEPLGVHTIGDLRRQPMAEDTGQRGGPDQCPVRETGDPKGWGRVVAFILDSRPVQDGAQVSCPPCSAGQWKESELRTGGIRSSRSP
jgi:DNA polymerase IV